MSFDSVRVRRLERAYEDQYALAGVDADFTAGAATALLGPNGAGKSTLVSILSTLVRPTAGDVFFGDTRVVSGGRDVRRVVGYVGHSTMLYRTLTARENLHFFGSLYGVPDLEKAVSALLEEVGLSRDADRPIDGFSRGMGQRLTLARALIHEPRVLLLDEPLTGLDQQGVTRALELLAARRDAGAILVVVSHDLRAIGELADRAVVLRGGRKVFEGDVEGDLASTYHAHVDRPAA